MTTARRRAIDSIRRSARGKELQIEATTARTEAAADDGVEPELFTDDRLRLFFTCCHPALRMENRVALTLRLLGGLSVDEIARAFLLPEATMAKRLVRAKHKIRVARIPYRVPGAAELPRRVRSVLAVVYLIYNHGIGDPGGESLRGEAVRLARGLADLVPDEPEAAGLLALLLLNDSRAAARFRDGAPVLLRDQDRTLWDRALIAEGHALVRECIDRDRPGPYQLQAAIQAVHCDAESFAKTDWSQVVALYDHLVLIAPTPVIAMNRAIALGEVAGAETALAALEPIVRELDGYHLMHAARGAFLDRLDAGTRPGRPTNARRCWPRRSGSGTSSAGGSSTGQAMSPCRDVPVPGGARSTARVTPTRAAGPRTGSRVPGSAR